jgi:hypothetical protein
VRAWGGRGGAAGLARRSGRTEARSLEARAGRPGRSSGRGQTAGGRARRGHAPVSPCSCLGMGSRGQAASQGESVEVVEAAGSLGLGGESGKRGMV